jgi:hypothetical protein
MTAIGVLAGTILIEIDVLQCEAAVITDLSTRCGTTLVNGLPKDAPLEIRPTCPPC